jgi:hypothetical protein
METPKTLIENTARLHGKNDLAGMLARDLVAALAALILITPSHRSRGAHCWCGHGRDTENAGHEEGCTAARELLGLRDDNRELSQ